MRTLFIATIFTAHFSFGQISLLALDEVKKTDKYLFYLHGAIVQEMGVNAVSEDFGAYEYLKIVNTFSEHNFKVISEARPKGTDVVGYAKKISSQIDTLLSKGVQPDHITVVGASQGAYIAIEAAHLQKNQKIRYVIMALCNDYNVNFYSQYSGELCGNFLSIYEASDQKLSCNRLLNNMTCKSGYEEIKLSMGNGHGFIFKPYPEWVTPIVKWINKK